ncbi:hypothetical protein [Streptomyces harbinensis]|uniref:hypothetical protein n=1 Tax=Streptomyces harbinensis TaxID=1176198 RepID=UPI001114A1F6|nr:hypothetical protein [Streptomyces harbinensis]
MPTIDAELLSDASCTLVELACTPDDSQLQARAVEQLAPLLGQLRSATGLDAEDDSLWLNAWDGYGINRRERTR